MFHGTSDPDYVLHLPAAGAVEALVTAVTARVVLLGAVALDVVVVIHGLGVLLGVVMGLDLVGLVQALGLGELVNLSTDETGDRLLRECVLDRLACYTRWLDRARYASR